MHDTVLNEQQVSVTLEVAAKINFACHQNSYPVLRELRLENLNSTESLENLEVTLVSNPGFLAPKTWHVDRISANKSLSIQDRDIVLDGSFLMNLVDGLKGTITIRVEKKGELIAEASNVVELLAKNEWGGAGYMPELLASFVTPNDPAIDHILHSASEILRKAGKPAGMDGYQSGSRQRVWEIASAIYSALVNVGISYSEPPASFENDGQKIRTPSRVLESKVGTCLDTSILFASVLEQAGLNPIIALPQGHAIVGIWLQPDELSAVVTEEAEILRKRSQLNEMLLVESTCITHNNPPSFSSAVNQAIVCLAPENDNSFNAAIDIKRARMHRISPIGIAPDIQIAGVQGGAGDRSAMGLDTAPALSTFSLDQSNDAKVETPQGRVERWQRKLLDLTNRNPLLNHKATTTSLKFVCPEPDKLEDKLAAGERISINHVPQASSSAQDEAIHKRRTGESIAQEYARAALEKKQVLVDLPEAELAKRSVEIYRKAQTALQEGGSNTLYLALGFLLWKRDEADDKRFRAPLILMPVALERKSVRSGIKMVAHDDEPRFNTTLLEMLRKDFGIDIKGLDNSLPTDHSGVDVALIWNTVRAAIKDAVGFEVVEDVVLGHFSFAKFLMWKDLVDRTNDLRENQMVRHLIDTPRESYACDIDFVDGRQIDRDFLPEDLLVPRPADASQMAAIATAEKGKDFVIIGPPGTGKSQTISNMIAHLLGKGKTVLFVSEKTAALEVVYRRLNEVGLGRFCLQVHSNKARKADVLNQFRTNWEGSNNKSVKNWKEYAQKLGELRDKLNNVVSRLHTEHPNGLTPHYAIGIRVRDHQLASSFKLSWPGAFHHDKNALKRMRECVETLAIQAEAVGGFSDTTLSLVSNGDWSPQWETQLIETAGNLATESSALERASKDLCERLGIALPDQKLVRLDSLGELAALLLKCYRTQAAFALEADGPAQIEALETAVVRLKSYAASQAALSCAYEPMAWRNLDGAEIENCWNESKSKWWLIRILSQRKIIKDMQLGGAKGKPNPEKDAQVLQELRKHGESIDALETRLSQFKEWKGHLTEPSSAEEIGILGQQIRVAVGKLVDDTNQLLELRAKIRTLLKDGNDLLAPDSVLARTANTFNETLSRLNECTKNFENTAGESVREHFSNSEKALESIRIAAESVVAKHRELRDWCSWRKRRTEAVDLDLLPLVRAIENGHISIGNIVDSFEAAYCAWWSAAIIGEDNVLRTFSTAEHEIDITKFGELDTKFQVLTADYITATLSGNLPEQADVKKSSQWGVLRHELQKKTRHKPIRQLMQEIPEVVTTLAPCLMMSPLSVAQYLPPNQKPFDVVIFDEASQITVWDAVGAIARGKQVIITGDPKQMPPTNFFARGDGDIEGETSADEADLESILDEMLGASVPKLTLALHYRSRRESLIAFSNAKYYDNCLVTFPAPVFPDKGVRLIKPTGFYARGGARHNEGEAKAIVAEIIRRLTHADPEVRNKSIGVVSFNSEQQSLIQNLLDDACSKNPGIEWAFSTENVLEPVFVKNLETVQGDERDIILFSITYGPDQSGHVTMNFGPLNRTGGERRLNVAMTRAREEMVVFSTLSADKIDLSRTQSLAISHLKHFLEYADRGPSVIGSFSTGSIGDFESPFETAVARALKDLGWEVHPQIGVSAYRIDLGVTNPDAPGNYLAGIECDGAMYHSSAYARERDKIRQSVLNGLGWSLYRVWSTDWWTNKEKAIAILHAKLQEKLKAERLKSPGGVTVCTSSKSG